MVQTGSELFDSVTKWAHKWTGANISHADKRSEEKVILDTSWAVWNRPDGGMFTKNSDVSYPGDAMAREHAHVRVIILGMNPGNDASRGNWSNFHHAWKSRDQLLAEACRDTDLQGALMTDLFFDQFESDSIALNVSGAAAGVARILEIIESSGETDPLILCLGGKTFAGLRRGLKELRKSNIMPVPNHVSYIKLTHYSGAAAGSHKHDPQTYRSIVHQQITSEGFGKFLAPSPTREYS